LGELCAALLLPGTGLASLTLSLEDGEEAHGRCTAQLMKRALAPVSWAEPS
jgi:hypothetical protein